MFKKSTFLVILGLCIVHISLVAQEKATTKTPITNSIYFGGEFNWGILGVGGGGYIGVETNFDNPYVSLINTIGISYASAFNYTWAEDFPNYNAIGMYYSIGLRVYLGIRYVFMDFNLGINGYISTPYQSEKWYLYALGTVTLGFNIPISQEIDFQLSGSIGSTMMLFGFQFRAGLQFKL